MAPSPLNLSAPAVEFEPHWRALPGMAHGIGQPVMLGAALVSLTRPLDLAALDRAMEQVISEPVDPPRQCGSEQLSLTQRVLDWTAALQRQWQMPAFQSGHAWLRTGPGQAGKVHAAVPYAAPQPTVAALEWVAQTVSGFVAQGEVAWRSRPGFEQELERIKTIFQPLRPQGVNPLRFLKAAHTLDVPIRKLAPDVVCFGQGRHSRWLESSYTDRTSVIGTRIARDKRNTATVLRQLGLPAPSHALAGTPEQAVHIANQLGYPVVVKPADRDQGLGVAADLRNDAMVRAAFQEASQHSSNILVEKHFHGQDFRLTVFNGRLIKATLRLPGGVTGNGRQSIAALVELAQQDAQQVRRARERGRMLLELDTEARELLTEYGLSPESVPQAGQYVCLRRRSNISAGGTAVKVEQPIHPDNRRLAERAADALRLDLAGIDLIITDISRSWLETGALICEVNGQPQIGIGTSPGIYTDILRELMQGRARIPVVLVIGDAGHVDERLMQLWQARGAAVGRASADGVWQGQERITRAQSSVFPAALILMANPAIDAAIVTMTPAQIMLYGLPFDRCEVLILAGPESVNSWSDAELTEMWQMALPHVAQAIVVAQAVARWLPDTVAPGLSVLKCAGDGEVLAQTAFQFLSTGAASP